jgi:hypothetical protein
MEDRFVGTWILNIEKSEFDANHHPRAGTMIVELDEHGYYIQNAEGINEKGEKHAERPLRFIADGKPHPIPDFPGLKYVTAKPDAYTMTGEVTREDGSVVGASTTVISADGKSKTITNFGYDSQFRQFKLKTVWDRQ